MLFAEKLSDGYLAGIWRSDPRGIMWSYPSIPMTPLPDLDQVLAHLTSSDKYVAPSWSWVGHRYMTFAIRPAIQPPKLLHASLRSRRSSTGKIASEESKEDGEEVSLFLDWQVDTEQECHG
ncbi:hypothetical protein ANO14919_074280 [Xylariales sp. No.14919]|nr:hypothetical protein ANO14919_074280 [Xylariales sp. No.14919]